MAAILKNRYDVITPPPIAGLLQNLAGGCKMASTRVKMETGSTIQIWRPSISETGSSFISAVH